MTIQPLLLDDLKWQDMVTANSGRIAAISGEEWTLHAAVDPGITLVELLAADLELRSYWLDRVPDSLTGGLIALLGAARRPAQAATTVFELSASSVSTIPADSLFQLANGGPALRMATCHALDLLQAVRIDLASPFGTRSLCRSESEQGPQRWAMQPLPLLAADHGAGEVAVTLWLKSPPQPGQSCALLLELDAAAGVLPAWDNAATADVPPPAALRFAYSTSPVGGRQPFAANRLEDGTAGLRRSGLVRFAAPADWQPCGPAQGSLLPYRLWVQCDQCGFAFAPQLRRIAPNAVIARHALPVTVPADWIERQIAGWLPLPDNELVLPGVLPPLEDSLHLAMRSRDEVWRDWRVVDDFQRSGPEDPAVRIDRTANRLQFGNGLAGRLPVPSRQPGTPMTITYRAGGGTIGNVGVDLEWTGLEGAIPPSAVNLVAGTGGLESESADAARERIGAELFECHRAVTLDDTERLAETTPGVGTLRAHALAGSHPAFPCVSVPGAIGVTIVPWAPRGEGWQRSARRVDCPQPDPGMLQAVRERLEAARLLTAEVHVTVPVYRAIDLDVALSGAPYDVAAVNVRLIDGMAAFLDPLVGGSEGRGWPFGGAVRPSELAHVLQDLAGNDAVVERAMIRFAGETGAFSECDDLVIAPGQLVALGAMRLRWSAPVAAQGGLS